MGRAPCCDKANVKRGPWSPEEDAKLKSYIHQNGTGGNWIALPHKIGLKRCGKSCRLRWLNYLRPNIKHGGFSEEEDNIICNLYISIGSRWSIIAAQLPGRTDNDIKNYWNTRLKKKLIGKQRKVQQARRSEILKTENESFNILTHGPGGFIMNNQAQPYWPDQLSSTTVLPIVNPNYNDNSEALKDQASVKNDFDYPIGHISCAEMYHQENSFNMLSTCSDTTQLTSTTTCDEFEAANHDGNIGQTHFQVLENLQVELNKLIYSNPQSELCGDFYGWNMMVNGSTMTSSTSADSGSFGEINSSNYYFCPPMVSDSENYQTDIMPQAHQDSSAFQDHYSSYFGQK